MLSVKLCKQTHCINLRIMKKQRGVYGMSKHCICDVVGAEPRYMWMCPKEVVA